MKEKGGTGLNNLALILLVHCNGYCTCWKPEADCSIHKSLVTQITIKFLTHGGDPITSWEQTESTFHCIFCVFIFSFFFQVGSTAFYFGEYLIQFLLLNNSLLSININQGRKFGRRKKDRSLISLRKNCTWDFTIW